MRPGGAEGYAFDLYEEMRDSSEFDPIFLARNDRPDPGVSPRHVDAEIASEVYSTAGDFDLLCKFYVEDSTDIGHFVNEMVQVISGFQDTRTIITFKAFG